MSEQWDKKSGTNNYEITDMKVIRIVNKEDLEARKIEIQNEIVELTARLAQINEDITKIDELEAK